MKKTTATGLKAICTRLRETGCYRKHVLTADEIDVIGEGDSEFFSLRTAEGISLNFDPALAGLIAKAIQNDNTITVWGTITTKQKGDREFKQIRLKSGTLVGFGGELVTANEDPESPAAEEARAQNPRQRGTKKAAV